MNLFIKVLSGVRKNQKFNLPLNGLYFYENEALEFKLILDTEFSHVSIFFHETELECTTTNPLEDNKFEYIWMPKKNYSFGYECLFHNYFGIAELTLVVDNKEYATYEMEVLTSKIKAERVERMLSFLMQEDDSILWSFFRATRINAKKPVGDISINHSIEQLEYTIIQIEKLLNKILNKPMVKVIPKIQYTSPRENYSLDDTTIAWLSDNADILFEVDNRFDALIELDDNFYSTHTLKTNILVNDTDIYENQVLHGFVHKLKLDTNNIIVKLNTKPNINYTKNYAQGYESLFNQLNKFVKKLNIQKIKKCENLMGKLDYLLYKMNKTIPIKTIQKGIPNFTQKIKHNFLYSSYFKKIIEWSQRGEVDWSVTEELFSIKDIPTLFEYYLLFYIKNILEKSIGNAELVNDKGLKEIRFIFDGESEQISLDYQPKFWVKSHKERNIYNLINSEKWALINKKIKERNHTHEYALRSPDITLTLFDSLKKVKCFIIDAKYTTSDRMFMKYLPELTLKYLHGIHHRETGSNHSLGLMIVNPSEQENIRHFHHDDYNIFSKSPILPSLICSSINIEDELCSTAFSGLIDQIVKVMKELPI